ncbi:MAG: NmrA family NAD(P)-binding protein [Bacteroidota bacterium]|nr:NmrA family NAD(P)-binding protein [Bacteroidota bacterium]
MKITITGSLGHISKSLTEALVKKGHDVTVISSKAEKKKDIEILGANAAIGSIDDVDFLTSTFTGMDAVYIMEPPFNFFDKSIDPGKYYEGLANGYKQAIQQSGVKRVIHLSSIGAHTKEGVGMLAAHHEVENILKQLPGDVSIKFMRPVGFYYNMFAYIQTIKTQDAIVQNYGGDNKEPWVSPLDIAAAIAEEFEKPFDGRTVRYIASDEVAPNEVARILGEAIGKPGLKWIEITDEQLLNGMLAAGFNPKAAKGLVEMNAGRRSGILYEDYNKNKPMLAKVKLKDFAKSFAAVYNQG